MFQIEKLWGLHAEIPAALRWLPDARFMFVQKHLNPRYRCSPVSETEGDPENDEEKDAPTMWAKRRVAGQPFSQYIVSGYSLILALPLLAVGVVLLLS